MPKSPLPMLSGEVAVTDEEQVALGGSGYRDSHLAPLSYELVFGVPTSTFHFKDARMLQNSCRGQTLAQAEFPLCGMASLGTADSDLSVAKDLDFHTSLPIRSADSPFMGSDPVPCATQMQSLSPGIISDIPSPQAPNADVCCSTHGNDGKPDRAIIDSNHGLCRARFSFSSVAGTTGVAAPTSYPGNARKIQSQIKLLNSILKKSKGPKSSVSPSSTNHD
ncbi:hypothetical protein Nepgr_006830 [Nepenthes gracilis]|uniref:Uncharacterized protein n=1 Tax=Nepenthes gracilis TaxID=150966 RepID=A0AAD3S5U4_NEPGR|nr:hypothetical protein Nepgr_006830 [Nepenthes gracilis]